MVRSLGLKGQLASVTQLFHKFSKLTLTALTYLLKATEKMKKPVKWICSPGMIIKG